ncbi:hypothetical protein [Pedobacter punctiformis]|uniref:DUF4968 domain-containing protein n=1 Tax=Pedobacter punctiformis TaxID=3004097 RepID=A0ABT4L5Q2_9SPHI|nr:hypothetical protein [Pedobacter sp. HCMS5-2]MCZ4243252.1 hypothetical protein [Pedobacter sp. HCMS5-2]
MSNRNYTKYIFVCIITLISYHLYAQNDNPVIKKSAATVKAFVPDSWKIIYSVSGDLNKDLLQDEAIIIENTNPKNFLKNDEMGANVLNINPRKLLVLFKNKDGYQLVAENTKFIPTENSEESRCLEDPLSETKALAIEKGSLRLSFQYFYSCGAWEVTNNDYIFRYQNNQLELIGADSHSYHRASGEKYATSSNFSTFKQGSTSGGNMFGKKDNPKTKWQQLKRRKLITLQNITEDVFERFMDQG